MRIHHLNCGCMCPVGGRLYDGFSKGLTARLVCHCLLVETERHGLVLVDTGFGRGDVARPERLSRFFRVVNNVRLESRRTAVEQLEWLGFSPSDVRHIVLTHLDFDHAGGLEDFPEATVHVLQSEMDAARNAAGFIARNRYRREQWDRVKQWRFYEAGGERWFGFEAVREPLGLPPDILLVPLAGHTRGHAGVAVRGDGKWLLHAGDAYFHRDEIGQISRRCPPGLRLYQTMMEVDRGARRTNQVRLRALSLQRPDEVRIFCSHDALELRDLATRRP